MKKFLLAISMVATIGLAAPAIQFVRAQSVDLGVENVGLLPSNPFYFLKEWSRGFRRLFTTNPAHRAELELNIVNEKAAELKQLGDIAPYNDQALINAAANYKNAVDALKTRLENLKDTSENPDIDRLIDQLVDRSVKHQQFFDELAYRFSDKQNLKDAIEAADDDLTDAVASVPARLDDPAKFRGRFENAVGQSQDGLRELRASQFVDRLEERVPEEAKKDIAALKEDLLISFSGRLQGLQLSASSTAPLEIENLPGDHLRELKFLDEIREITQNPDLKNNLNLIRQKILEQATQSKEIGERQAREAIDNVKKLIADLEAKIGAGPVRVSVKELLGRAKFNLEQAETFFQDENYGAAYGQATAAYATAKAAWNQLMPTVFDHAQTLEAIKKYYDGLSAKAVAAGLNKEQNPKIFALLGEAEKRIVDLSKLLESGASPEVIARALKDIKFLLATIGELIQAAANPPALPPVKIEPAPPAPAIPTEHSESGIPDSITVVISDGGFIPPAIKVRPGTKVTWFNKDIRPHWPASDPHPTHTLLPGFDALSGLKQGETYTFTFDKVGHWTYHDHLNPESAGVVEVVE